MKKINVIVKNDNGLHSRVAISLVTLVKNSNCEISIVNKEGMKVNGKSLIRILSMGIKENEEICIEISGEDEDSLANDICNLFS